MAGVSRGHSTTAIEVGRAERQERTSTLSSSWDEQRRQNTPERDTTGQRREVKLPSTDQRVEQSPAQDKGTSDAENENCVLLDEPPDADPHVR